MKVLILAPHQDDEIILCGSFLKGMLDQGNDVYVVFMTNGDYNVSVRTIRLEEALKVMELYGVPSDHIIFMGYANEYDSHFPHIYNASEENVVSSQYGNTETYGLEVHPEYCYRKYGSHHTYTREHILNDLYEIVSELKPDLIFATGEEVHPDHSANSLILDEVMGALLKEYPAYRPFILKKPEYHTAWFGPDDYSQVNNPSARFEERSQAVSVNGSPAWFYDPYIRWRDRIRLPIDRYARCTDEKNNIVAQALNLYRSQNAEKHFRMLLNSDVVFWPRRTDSLTYTAEITASSGEAKYLADFKRNDSDDLKRKSGDVWNQNASVWHPSPEDKRPVIEIRLQSEEIIDEIIIYQEYCPKSVVDRCRIILDQDHEIWKGPLQKRRATVIRFAPQKALKIQIMIESRTNQNELPGISEIEVYPYHKTELSFMKLMVNGSFAYHYILQGKEREKVEIYAFDSNWHIHYPHFENVVLHIVDLYGTKHEKEEYFDNRQNLKKLARYPILLQVSDPEQKEIYDRILIFKSVRSEKKFASVCQKLSDMGIPEDDILSFYFGRGNDRLRFLKKFYLVARDEHHLLAVQIKYEFLKILSEQRKSLSELEKKDGFCFLLFDELNEGISPYMLKYVKSRLSHRMKNEKNIKKKIWLIGTPNHHNAGDHFIAFATRCFLEKIFDAELIREVEVNEFAGILPNLAKHIRTDDVIILQGGGNMGNIYWTNERIRREILIRFPKNPVFIFPETIFYETDLYGMTDKKRSAEIYKKAKRLTICAREMFSYADMREIYSNAKILLTPDIVCSMDLPVYTGKRQGVSLFIRSDKEACITDEQRCFVEEAIRKTGMEYRYSDMIYNKARGYSGKANRETIVRTKLTEFQRSKLIVTDRLHAMILSVITGTPCVVFHGYNHKIPSTYETWFQDIPYIRLIQKADDFEQAMSEVVTASTENGMQLEMLRGKFQGLKEEILEAYQ